MQSSQDAAIIKIQKKLSPSVIRSAQASLVALKIGNRFSIHDERLYWNIIAIVFISGKLEQLRENPNSL